MGDSCDVYLSVRVGGLLGLNSYNIMHRPLLSRLTSCGTDSYAWGRLVVRTNTSTSIQKQTIANTSIYLTFNLLSTNYNFLGAICHDLQYVQFMLNFFPRLFRSFCFSSLLSVTTPTPTNLLERFLNPSITIDVTVDLSNLYLAQQSTVTSICLWCRSSSRTHLSQPRFTS
jgi:hypothetical protein